MTEEIRPAPSAAHPDLSTHDSLGLATDTELGNHLTDATDAHDASAISVTPAGNITSTDVQAALVELDGDIAAGGIPATIVDAKGDLIVATAADTVARRAVGADGTVLTADAAEATGVKWAAGGGLGAWTTYTPTWTAVTTNPTLGSTTIAGRYKLLDATTLAVAINIVITTGGAWNAGSGNYIFSLPAGVTSAARIQVGSAHVLDSGTAHFSGTAKVGVSATTIGETIIADATGARIMSNVVPVTWATNDQININMLVEIA